MNSYTGNLSVKSFMTSLSHEIMKCSYWVGAVLLYHAIKEDLVWSHCRRFTYRKEINTTTDDLCCSITCVWTRRTPSFTAMNSNTDSQTLYRCSRSVYSNRNFLLRKCFPFILCHSGWHYSNVEDVEMFALLYANYITFYWR